MNFLILSTLALSMGISMVQSQSDIQNIVGAVPWDAAVDKNCIIQIYTSGPILDAFEACGGLSLLALNTAPVSILQSPTFLPTFCSANCTSAIAALRGSLAPYCDSPNPTANPSPNLLTTSQNPSYTLSLFAGQNFESMVSALQAASTFACLTKPDGSYCIQDDINRGLNVLKPTSLEGITATALASNLGVACTDCFNQAYKKLTDFQDIAPAFFAFMQPAFDAFSGIKGNCTTTA
ncbi:hypothetical protein HDU76_007880 [Blyttiomyces sp. JEL0837]|nr:hypothetical protein HDU76_007880 [Blyttiomyces sp. JEL0837]